MSCRKERERINETQRGRPRIKTKTRDVEEKADETKGEGNRTKERKTEETNKVLEVRGERKDRPTKPRVDNRHESYKSERKKKRVK